MKGEIDLKKISMLVNGKPYKDCVITKTTTLPLTEYVLSTSGTVYCYNLILGSTVYSDTSFTKLGVITSLDTNSLTITLDSGDSQTYTVGSATSCSFPYIVSTTGTKIVNSYYSEVIDSYFDYYNDANFYIINLAGNITNPQYTNYLSSLANGTLRFDLVETITQDTSTVITQNGKLYTTGSLTINGVSAPSNCLVDVYVGQTVLSDASSSFYPLI